jgi:hypothetical protein
LRASYAAIRPGYHLNKRYWNTITLRKLRRRAHRLERLFAGPVGVSPNDLAIEQHPNKRAPKLNADPTSTNTPEGDVGQDRVRAQLLDFVRFIGPLLKGIGQVLEVLADALVAAAPHLRPRSGAT